MADAWPGTLPQTVLNAGYSETVPDTLLRSAMDTGPAKVRSRFTVGIPEFKYPEIMTTAQVATLDTFYKTTLGNGALPFTWVNARTGAAADFRFLKPPTYDAIGAGNYRVMLYLEILP